NYMSASWHMGELFYTNNGVPMEEDKYFDYDNRYRPRRATPGDHHESYIATNQVTAGMHFHREPRFYANLVIDRGFFELASTTEDGGRSFSPFVQSRGNEIVGTQGQASYTPKKSLPLSHQGAKGLPAGAIRSIITISLYYVYRIYTSCMPKRSTKPKHNLIMRCTTGWTRSGRKPV